LCYFCSSAAEDTLVAVAATGEAIFFDRDEVTVHRERRTSQSPLGGSRKDLDSRDSLRVCEELGLDWSELPGSKGRV